MTMWLDVHIRNNFFFSTPQCLLSICRLLYPMDNIYRVWNNRENIEKRIGNALKKITKKVRVFTKKNNKGINQRLTILIKNWYQIFETARHVSDKRDKRQQPCKVENEKNSILVRKRIKKKQKES